MKNLFLTIIQLIFINIVFAQTVTCVRYLTNPITDCSGPVNPPTNGGGLTLNGIGLNGGLFWESPGLVFTQYSNGTATLTGTAKGDPGLGSPVVYTININYSGYTASLQSPIQDNDCSPVTDFSDWFWYTSASGEFFIDATRYTVARRGPAYQTGTKGNHRNLTFGSSGWHNLYDPNLNEVGFFDIWSDVSACSSLPTSCSYAIDTLCTDGSQSITFTAQAGLTGVIWKDSTSNTTIGTGNTLTINGTESFLADGYEAIYFSATDANGCPGDLCCKFYIVTKSCIVCTAALTVNSTQCNNNGTLTTGADDWFTLNVTGTITSGSGNYVIKIGAFTSPSTPSGTAISIPGNGQGGNPLLKADGVTTYSVTIEDATNSACYNTITVGPVQSCSSCPNPNCFTVTKQRN